jgi:hypothetical protein
MRPSNTIRLLVVLALLAISSTAAPAAWAQAIITNGTVTLGVNAEGHLNVDGGIPSAIDGETIVGLRNENNFEGLSHGTPCEGWGVGVQTTGISGWANRCWGDIGEPGPVVNLTVPVGGFTFTGVSARSITRIQDAGGTDQLEVTHNFAPVPWEPSLYQIDVTIRNVGTTTLGDTSPLSTDLRYRRVMDWDAEHTMFEDFVTIGGLPSPNVVHSGDDGFEIADPLQFEFGSPTDQYQFFQQVFGVSPALPCAPPDGFLVNFVQCGSFIVDPGPPVFEVVADQGTIFDFGFPGLAPGEARTFTLWYGAAPTTARADEALYNVNAQVYSYAHCRPFDPTEGVGHPSCDLATGAPVTYIFAAAFAGGTPVFGDIHGHAYVDLNGNGALDLDTDTPLPGVTMTLSGTTTGGDSVSMVATTGADGTYVFPTLVPGTYTVTAPASVPGFTASTANPIALTLARGEQLAARFGYVAAASPNATTTAVVSSANPSVFGQPVTFTATVTNAGSPVTTGTVAFRDGATILGAVSLNAAGQAALTTSTLSVDSHAITATYTGSLETSSGSLTQVVEPAATTTTATSSVNPSTFGQSVTFTATVAAQAPGAGTPTGTVTFKDGLTTLGTAPLDGSAQATFTTSALSIGTHPITAEYAGDANFVPSAGGVSQLVLEADTTTALISSANPSFAGQPVTFTAMVTPVAPASGTPAGTVTFLDGATVLGTSALDASGQAAFTTSALTVGPHPITAQYSGSPGFTGSTSPVVNQLVLKKATATGLTSNVNPSVVGQSVTFTATVTPVAPGTGTPTGNVIFKNGTTVLATTALDASGQAAFSTSALGVGTHPITAEYTGDADFTGSTSPILVQVVQKVGTTTGLTSSLNPSTVGQSVTFTATVAVVAPGTGTPTGSVIFRNGALTLATVPVGTGGQAALTTSALAIGTHPITAEYTGDAAFTGSTSPVVNQIVQPTATTTGLTSSVNPSVVGQPVTFTATVSAVAPGTGTPAGTVTFRDGAITLVTVALNAAGQAQLSTSALTVGTHPITAQYNGSATFSGSTSPVLNQVVQRAGTGTGFTSSVNPSTVGQPVTFTASVSVTAPGAGVPTGSVTFKDGATILAVVPLDAAGQATFTTSALTAGTHPVTAEYSGDANFSPSTSPVVNQVVQPAAPAPTTTTLTSSLNPSSQGQPVTFTATVMSGSTAVGTGTVTFREGALVLAGPTAVNGTGQASFTTSALTAGSHTITATYNGTASFAPSSGTVVQRVNATNASPDCSRARPNDGELWPPNHKMPMVKINVLGVTDPDGDRVTIRITRILQDEPTNTTGDGNTAIDGGGIGTSTALVRHERAGNRNGRVYEIQFTGTDSKGATCTGTVGVTVPHDQGKKGAAVDDGIRYDSITGVRVR